MWAYDEQVLGKINLLILAHYRIGDWMYRPQVKGNQTYDL